MPRQALRRATAGDRAFAAAVHRAHATCLLSRALAFDAAADDDDVRALVLSELPLQAHPPPATERGAGGVTREQAKTARTAQRSAMHARLHAH